MENISVSQQRQMAVAYLIRNVDKQPEGTKDIFAKLLAHEKDAATLESQINQANKAIEEMASRISQKIGAIEGIADILKDMIPEDKLEEYVEGFNALKEQKTEEPVKEDK